jgi:RNA polymerase-interacting CarD/CdnL/TRCF family regulator
MTYKIGDKVIHSSFGFAEITGIEEKTINGNDQLFYIVQTKDMQIWIPITDELPNKIRTPTSQMEFEDCFIILQKKYTPLSTDRSSRKSDIHGRIILGTTRSLCELIRDLSFYKGQNKINEYEKTTLDRAIQVLVDEWCFVFTIPESQVRSKLSKMLSVSYAKSI